MAADWRCASDRKAGDRTSGTQIWIGLRPCSRRRSRCSRTLMRDGLAPDAEAMTNLQSELHVTYHEPPGSASHFHRGSLPGRPPPLSGPSWPNCGWMALRALISLRFLPKRLAGGVWPLAKTIRSLNHIRGAKGQAFVLPSKLRPVKIRRNRDGWRNSP